MGPKKSGISIIISRIEIIYEIEPKGKQYQLWIMPHEAEVVGSNLPLGLKLI